MNRLWRTAGLALVLALAGGMGVVAQPPTGLEGIKGADDRIIVDAIEYPWSAVGRLNNRLGAYCTGTLVARDLVLTAGHCLWNRRTRAWLPVQSLHFIAGYQRGEHLADAAVVAYHVAPGFDGAARYDGALAAHDWALVKLAAPIGEQVGWLGLQRFDAGEAEATRRAGRRVFRVGYGQDHKHVAMAHLGCGFQGIAKGGELLHGCDAVSGDSGSPIFVYREGSFRIIAIHVSTVGAGGKVYGGAVGSAAFIDAAKRLGADGAGSGGPPERTPVATVQKLLPRLGFDAGRSDGVIGDATLTAIRGFQERAGLAPSGAPSSRLLGRMLEALENAR